MISKIHSGEFHRVLTHDTILPFNEQWYWTLGPGLYCCMAKGFQKMQMLAKEAYFWDDVESLLLDECEKN